jgi:NADH-quinone oxidoreductase subunit G
VSMEGRAQRFFSVMPPVGGVRESWRWLAELKTSAAGNGAWHTLDQVIDSMVAEMPSLKGVRDAAPDASFRVNGLRVARKPLRESGRTAVTANIDIHEPKPAADADSPMAYTMEGTTRRVPSSLIPRFWSPGWNSDQSLNKFQAEVGGPLAGGDPGVRLVEPPASPTGSYFTTVPAAHAAAGDTVLLVSRHSVFGSEEMSARAPGIVQRSQKASLVLSASEAARVGLSAGQVALVTLESGATLELPVLVGNIPSGVASVLSGLPDLPALTLPARVRVQPRVAFGTGAGR